jgi:ribonuclease T1
VPRVRRPLLALIALVLALAIGYGVNAARSGDDTKPGPTATTSSTPLSGLPVQARQTVSLIEKGGPFPYPHNDGVVFHNNEHLLPRETDGYYHEYTVPTPGSSDRGARRIITGRDGEFFYTGDHYEHFVPIDVTR